VGELGETDYGAFLVSIRVSQNGTSLVLAAYITEVQRQSSSVNNVFWLLEGDLTFSIHDCGSVVCVSGV